MPQSLPEDPKSKQRGCIIVAILAFLFLLLLIAISSGWLGQVERGKSTHIVPISGNQS